MPDRAAALIAAALSSGLFQYPDVRVYNAATMLRPDERPTVPVEVVDPKTIYNASPNVGGFVKQPARDKVYISNKTDVYKNKHKQGLLAAILAHEEMHVKNGPRELPAYEKELDVVRRLTGSQFRPTLENLDSLIRTYRYMEEKDKK